MIRIATSVCCLVLFLVLPAMSQIETAPVSPLKSEIQVCTSITDRNPVGAATTFVPEVGQIYCWSKITGGSGEQAISHVWSLGGKVMAEVPLTIKGESWRTWSAKKILPSWTGEWEVKVKDSAGNTLASTTFVVGEVKK